MWIPGYMLAALRDGTSLCLKDLEISDLVGCKSLWEELNLLLPIRTTLEVAVRRTSMSRIGRGPVAALDMHRAQAGFPIPTSRVEDLDEQAGYAL